VVTGVVDTDVVVTLVVVVTVVAVVAWVGVVVWLGVVDDVVVPQDDRTIVAAIKQLNPNHTNFFCMVLFSFLLF
jgi:flagellar basal body-associated protein FliL